MKERNPKGRIFSGALCNKLSEIHAFLQTMDRSELDALDDDLAAATETNCSWILYQNRDALRLMVAEAVREIDSARRRARVRMGLERER